MTALIPLWAIGVFLSFTLSQLGMARRWWKIGHLTPGQVVREHGSTLRYQRGWQVRLVINGFGSVCTAVVTIIFAVAKFRDGAWIIVLLLPTMVSFLFAIHHHYLRLARELSLDKYGKPAHAQRHRVLMPISGVHRGTMVALDYARSLSADVTVVHISIDAEETSAVQEKWKEWGGGVRLLVIDSPYRTFIEPFLEYIDRLYEQRQPNERITIVVPQFVPERWWHNLLHTQTAFWLRFALLFKKGIAITEVPYQVD
jgi:hypothetical protein